MGVIRSILFVFVAVLLFFSFFAINLFSTLSLSLNYDNVQTEAANVIKNSLSGINLTNIVENQYNLIEAYCKNSPDSDFVFSTQGYTFDIPCSIALQGRDAIIEEGSRDLVHNVYYTKYDCNFLDCFVKSTVPLFLVSEKSYNFFASKFYWVLTLSIILLALSFFLIEKKTNLPTLAGILLIISALPFFKIDYLLSLLPNKIIFEFLGIFFSQAFFVSIRVLFIGIIILTAGIVLDIFKIGFKISIFISKIKEERENTKNKKIVKKAVKKSPKGKSK